MFKKKLSHPSFDSVRGKLIDKGFDIAVVDGGRYLVQKHGCAAGLSVQPDQSLTYFARPGRIVKGELARLVDRGYQKFLKTADVEVPALSEDLRALHAFQSELKHVLGTPSLYNESLGSVSDRYLYDRVWFRDDGKQPKAWIVEAGRP